MIDKYESRRIRVAIRNVLLGVWDPIGIKDEPNAQDEYDGYSEMAKRLRCLHEQFALIKRSAVLAPQRKGLTTSYS